MSLLLKTIATLNLSFDLQIAGHCCYDRLIDLHNDDKSADE